MTFAPSRTVCLFVLSAVAVSSGVFAQQPAPAPPAPPERPATAVFRGAQPPQQDILVLSTGIYGAYDEEASGEEGAPRGLANGGPFTGLDLGLAFTPVQDGDFNFNARVSSGLRYYPELSDLVAASHDGNAAVSFQLSRRTMIQARGGFGYTPYFDFETVPTFDADAPIVPVRIRDQGFSSRRVRTFDGGGDLTYSPSDRTSFGIGYGMRRTDLIEEGQSATDLTASARMSRRLNRRTTSRIAFVHRDGEHDVGGTPRPVRVNDLEIGLDRDWARSQTRRTTLSFTVGPSLVQQQGRQMVRAFGGAGVTHPFGRSWNLRAHYRRGVTFLDAVPDPVLSDSLTLNLSGLVTRKLDISLSAGAVLGEVGFETLTTTTLDTYMGAVRAQYALSRTLAFYGEYVYQSHAYNGDPAFTDTQNRSGIRVGLTWYAALLQDAPRPTPQPRTRPTR